MNYFDRYAKVANINFWIQTFIWVTIFVINIVAGSGRHTSSYIIWIVCQAINTHCLIQALRHCENVLNMRRKNIIEQLIKKQ